MKRRFPEVVLGNAGILPAAAGMLPAALCNIVAYKLPRSLEESSTSYAIQILREHQLCAAAFVEVIDFIKGAANEI